MVSTRTQLLTLEAFLACYPDNGRRYELIEGEVVATRPVGQHELIASFLDAELTLEICRQRLSWFSSRNTLAKPHRAGTADLPDVIALDREALQEDPYWPPASTILLGRSARLVIAVVSTN